MVKHLLAFIANHFIHKQLVEGSSHTDRSLSDEFLNDPIFSYLPSVLRRIELDDWWRLG